MGRAQLFAAHHTRATTYVRIDACWHALRVCRLQHTCSVDPYIYVWSTVLGSDESNVCTLCIFCQLPGVCVCTCTARQLLRLKCCASGATPLYGVPPPHIGATSAPSHRLLLPRQHQLSHTAVEGWTATPSQSSCATNTTGTCGWPPWPSSVLPTPTAAGASG